MDDFKRKLLALETLYGSQKKAAQKLGVSTSTYRRYKQSGLPSSREKQANRLLGNKRNKEKLEQKAPALEKKIKAFEEKQQRVKVMATNAWLEQEFGRDMREKFIVHNLKNETPYVAYVSGNKDAVQFFDYLAETGKPKGALKVTAYGIITQSYYVGQSDLASGNLVRTQIPILTGIGEHWDLQKTLDYVEKIFMGQSIINGRKKFNPTRFIGIKF
jgi:hypothetical protein